MKFHTGRSLVFSTDLAAAEVVAIGLREMETDLYK